MEEDHLQLLRVALDAYLLRLGSALEPDDTYLPYEYEYIAKAKWRPFMDAMLQDELREVTNQLHQWRDMLRSWQAWNGVASTYEDQSAWTLRREFMEPLMHSCLLAPSSFRDLLTFVGTNAVHQLRLHTEPDYVDHMEGDPTTSEPRPRPLTRRKKEDRLFAMVAPIAGSALFTSALRKLDDPDYRERTKDYRNSNSHAIGPRIAVGMTKMVTRQVGPATEMQWQPDGTGRIVTAPSRFVACYTFGGLEPLDPEAARRANLLQYERARDCFSQLTTLISSLASTLPRADEQIDIASATPPNEQ